MGVCVVSLLRTMLRASVRAVKGRAPVNSVLRVTSEAAQRLSSLVATQKDCAGIEVGVKTQGCSGLSYTLDFVTEAKIPKRAEVIDAQGVTVFVSPKALFSIIGSEMDFVENKLSSEFVFNNPNVGGTCGCGESFMMAGQENKKAR